MDRTPVVAVEAAERQRRPFIVNEALLIDLNKPTIGEPTHHRDIASRSQIASNLFLEKAKKNDDGFILECFKFGI